MLGAWFAERGLPRSTTPDGTVIARRFSDPNDEHLATRRSAGLFDFSFMGGWEIAGRDALAFLHRLQVRNLGLLESGRLAYTLLCASDGSVFIDATVWCHTPRDRYWLFSGRRSDHGHLTTVACDFDVELTPLLPAGAVIALQGPSSFRILERTTPGVAGDLPYYGFRRAAIDGIDAWIARLGYTGEIGYELLVHADDSIAAWQRILASAQPGELAECGWECANSLRIEAGFVHFEYEFAERVSPMDLPLARLVSFEHADFVGRVALRAAARRRPLRTLAGIAIDRQQQSLRADAGRGRRTARTTSVAFSPLFGQRLALAFVERSRVPGSMIYTETGERGRTVRLPFFDPLRAVPRRSPQ